MSKKISLLLFLSLLFTSSWREVYGQNWSSFGKGLQYGVNFVIRYNGTIWVASDSVHRLDGLEWKSVSNGMLYPLGVGDIYALGVLNGTLYAGGIFTVLTPDGDWYNNVGRLYNGSWTTCGSGLGNDGWGTDGDVYFLLEYNGSLYAGGNFGSAGGDPLNPQAAPFIARFDGSQWFPVGAGTNDKVTDMVVYNNQLIVSGYFTMAGNVSANHIVSWNGSSWNPLGSGINGKVTALAAYNGYLYAGGLFDSAGNVPAKNIARWDGQSWSAVGEGLANQVYTLAFYNGKLYAGGNELYKVFIDSPPYSITHYLMVWDGSKWDTLSGGPNGPVSCLLSDTLGLIVGGSFSTAGNISAKNIALFSSVTGVKHPASDIPSEFSLLQNYPNPFNPSTTISYGISKFSFVKLIVYDILGREVKVLVNENKAPGSYVANFNASGLPSGIYFCRLQVGNFTQTRKLALLK
jgi:hypothetical protein